MAVPTKLVDPVTGVAANVTEFGQLVVAPVAYSIPVTNSLSIINTPVNFITPKEGKQVVITDIILSTDKQVGANGASIQIYGAFAADSAIPVPNTSVLDIEMLKNTNRDLIGLNFLVPSGVWINVITDDTNIQVTIGYYYVPKD